MKPFEWDDAKNERLMRIRGISFEDVDSAIARGELLDVVEHPNRNRYPHQKVMIVKINIYAYAVPYIENETALFLKTIYPSRQYTKKYLQK